MLNFVTYGCIDRLKKGTIPASVLYGVTPTPTPILGIIIMLIDIVIICIRKGLCIWEKTACGFQAPE